MKITFIYVLLAIVAIISALYLSWPEEIDAPDFKGEALFEEYETETIREIELTTINKESGARELVTLQKGSDVWTIKERFGYHAGNTPKITNLTASLLDREIFDAPTDQQSDWEGFGVVDPTSEQAKSLEGYGDRLDLKDYRGDVKASLIVGKQVSGNQAQRFVRIPGQPLVYMIEFDYSLLTTDFAEWVDHNVLQLEHLGLRRQGKKLAQVQIHSYIIDTGSENPGGENSEGEDATEGETQESQDAEPKRRDIYRSVFDFGEEKWNHVSTEVVDGTGKMSELSDEQTKRFSTSRLEQFRGRLVFLPFTNVQKISSSVSNILKKTQIESGDLASLKAMEGFGIFVSESESGEIEFESSSGHLVVKTLEGVMYQVMFGNIVQDQGADSGIKKWMVIRASVDLTQIPEIPPLGDDASEDEKVSYQANVKARQQQLDTAVESVKSANEEFSKWLYVVNEDYLGEMRPDLELIFPAITPATQPAGPQNN